MIISTKKLLNIIFENVQRIVETRLILNETYCATHFIYTIDFTTLIDEGIDGEERELLWLDFLIHYKDKKWIIDNIT